MGTNEDELNRVVISRCEVDMIQIKEEYEELMKRSLEDHVSVCHRSLAMNQLIERIFFQKDTSGDYRKILLELLKDPSKRSAKPGKGKSNDFSSIDDCPWSFLAKYENVDLPGYEQPAVYKENLIVRILFDNVTSFSIFLVATRNYETSNKLRCRS